MSVQHYRQLIVWQKAMDLAALSYQITRDFPAEEKYGLISQLRRAATSVAANIAEGQGRHSFKEFLNHLSMARGSLMEVETLLLLSERIGASATATIQPLLQLSDEISRMISGLRNSLEAKLS